MYNNSYEITEDGFRVHTFELTIPYITKEEFERIAMNAEKSYINNDRNSICIYPKRRGVRIWLNHTDNNFYSIKVIVSPRRLIDEESDAVNILRVSDDFDLLDYLLNESIRECLGEAYSIDSFNLSRLDFCVNIKLSETFSAERYVKLIKRSMKYNDSAEVIEFSDDVTDAIEKNKHSFRIRTGNLTFTAYDKYFQLENIGESYGKASEGFLRLEIAVNRDEIRSFEESIQLESDNLNLIYILTCCSENVFKNYIRDHFYRGDYCYIDSMRLLIGISEPKKKDKKLCCNMLICGAESSHLSPQRKRWKRHYQGQDSKKCTVILSYWEYTPYPYHFVTNMDRKQFPVCIRYLAYERSAFYG